MFAQFLINGLITGVLYSLTAIGFALVYNTTHVFHMAAAALYVAAAYVFYYFYSELEYALLLSLLVSMALTSVSSLLIEWAVYRPLYKKKASSTVIMIASIGIMTIILNVLSMFFGDATKVINTAGSVIPPVSFWGINLTSGKRFIVITAKSIVLVCFVCGCIMKVLHRKSKFVLEISALSDNPNLFEVLGFNVNSTRNKVFLLSGLFFAVSSCLSAYAYGLNIQMGMPALVNALVAIIIGGFGRQFWPCVIGGLLLGVLQSFTMFFFAKEWMDVVTFVVLLIFLFIKPQGIFGYKRRLG